VELVMVDGGSHMLADTAEQPSVSDLARVTVDFLAASGRAESDETEWPSAS
jgi:hypothetical protein